MMNVEFTQEATVEEGGRVTVVVPDARPGDVVKVTVSTEPPLTKYREAGGYEGRIWMSDDFDDPVDELLQDFDATEGVRLSRVASDGDSA